MSQGKTLLVGTAWVALGQGLGFFLRFFSSWILAKMLAPEDYGRLGWAMAMVTLFELLSDLGLIPTLIRNPLGVTSRYLQTAWTMTFVRGAILGVCCFLVAGYTGLLGGRPTHGLLLALLGLRPLIMSLRSPGIVKRRAKLDFRALFIEEILQTVVGIATSVIWALYDPTANAIVAGTLVGAFTSVVITYFLEPMVPVWTWDKQVMLELGQTSKKIFLNTMVMALWMNLDRLVGPEWVNELQMGAYVLAWNLASAVEGLLTKALDVHYGQMAKKLANSGESDDGLDELHNKAGRWKRMYVFPAIFLMAMAAPLAIWILYDKRYENARIILPILILRLIPRLHGQFHFQRLLARGHLAPATFAYLIAAVGLIGAMIPFCALQVFPHWAGGKGLAVSVLISTVIWTLGQDLLAGRSFAKVRWEWAQFVFWTGSGLTVASYF